MRTPCIALPLLVLTACASGDHTAWEDVPLCSAELVEALPVDGEDVIGTNAEIVLWFDGQMVGHGGASIVTDPPIDYSYTVVEDRVVFSPSESLDPDTSYTWTAELCATEVASGAFTTRTEGDAVQEPETLLDRTFSMDLLDATWVEPSGQGGELLASYFAGLFLVGVQDVSDTELDVVLAVGEEVGGGSVQQDPCYETVDFEPADFTRNPYFELGPRRMPLEVEGQSVMLDSVQIFGALVDEGTDLTDAELKADADLRQVGPDWETYCDYGVLFGIVCTACESDGEEACVKLHVADIEGKVQAGVVIAEVLDADAECGDDDSKETDTSGGGA